MKEILKNSCFPRDGLITEFYEYFIEKKHIHIVTEHFKEGNLFDYIYGGSYEFNDDQFDKFCYQLAFAIDFLQLHSIAHRKINLK